MKIGSLLILLVLIHNVTGYLLGYWSARLFKLPEGDCRTVAIEVGMQNGGLASGIAKEMGKIATVGLAAAVFRAFDEYHRFHIGQLLAWETGSKNETMN